VDLETAFLDAMEKYVRVIVIDNEFMDGLLYNCPKVLDNNNTVEMHPMRTMRWKFRIKR